MTKAPVVRPVGDRAFLVELADNRQVHVLAAAVTRRYGDRIEDVVPGDVTVLLTWDGRPPSHSELTAELARIPLDGRPADADADPVTIAVHYDGPDLDAVADAIAVPVDRVVELHSQADYRVAFMGFAPGFAYMTGLNPELELPRRTEPRPRVPAGAVAIASTYSAVYPTSAPGGWHLLGHTEAVLFDPDRDPPALLAAGRRVRFRAG